MQGKPFAVLLVVITRIVMQFFVQYYETGFSFSFFWYEWLMTLFYVLIVILVYGVNFIFIFAGIIDFKRKLFFMKILQSMISVEKDPDFTFATYFPTLNICNFKNLTSWMQLRAACLDLGKKYTYRIFLYCSVFMAFYTTFFLFILLMIFGILNYNLPIAIYITGTFDVMIILGNLLYMIK